MKSLPVKEVNEQKLGNASITIGGEEDKENEPPSPSAPTRKEQVVRKTAARARSRPHASMINPVTDLSRSSLRAFAPCADWPRALFDCGGMQGKYAASLQSVLRTFANRCSKLMRLKERRYAWRFGPRGILFNA